ncbi:MAG: DUF342 domain-containing protein [Zhaonellaceae bacterium]
MDANGKNNVKHGTVAVLDGKVVVTDPEPGGNVAIIIPGEHVQIFVNGELIESPQEVRSTDKISLLPNTREPSWEIETRVSSDGMRGFARLHQQNGEIYKVPDQAPAQQLVIDGVLTGFNKPKIEVDEVIRLLNENKIVYGLMPEMIQLAIDSNSSEEFIVAKGQEPQPGVNGYIDCLFKKKRKGKKEDNGAPLVHVHDVISVEPGERLVEIVPPKPGKSGMNVYGNVVESPPAKKAKLVVGKGVQLTADEKGAIALISGRPVLKGNNLAVYPSYTLTGDIDTKTTGQIKFKGDLVIKGNVLDGMKIDATGKVLISGYVANSTIHAGGDIIIERNLVGGTVRAGGVASICQRLLSNLKSLVSSLKLLAPAVAQLKTHPSVARNKDLKHLGDGVLIKMLFNTKFSKVPPLFTNIDEDLEQLIQYYESPELEGFRKFFEEANKKICARVPVELNTVEKIDGYIRSFTSEADKVQGIILTHSEENARLLVAYVQNSTVESSGDVVVTGKGCYNSNIYAGGNVEIYNQPGVFRSGEISACGNVKVRELGSEAETITSVTLPKGKWLIADKVYPGVIIKAGIRIEHITSITYGLKITGQ